MMEKLLDIQEKMASPDAAARVLGSRQARELLDPAADLKLREIVVRSVSPKLVEFLRQEMGTKVHLESLLTVTNIATNSPEHLDLLVEHGIAAPLIGLLGSPSAEVVEQAMWLLGTLAADSHDLRASVLSLGGVERIVATLEREGISLSLQQIGAWTLSNVADAQMRPPQDVQAVVSLLARMLQHDDAQLLGHVCWAISHTCDGPTAPIQAVVKAGICPRLVELLDHEQAHVVKPALRAIGNIVCAEEDRDYTQHIVESGAVTRLRALVEHEDEDMEKEACWTLSNIAAGTVGQIQAVIDSGAIPPLVAIACEPSSNAEVRNEACWVLLNATSCGSDSQVAQLVSMDCVRVLHNLLSDSTMVMMALEGLEKVLHVADQVGLQTDSPEAEAAAVCGPTVQLEASKIDGLRSSRVPAVARKAAKLWKQHFVSCALCGDSFPKRAQDTMWCPECKCNVCPRCDCSVYHLNYQSELWREATEEESAAKQQKQASKRNKRARKRKKNKQKKALLKRLRDARAKGDVAAEETALKGLEALVGAARAQAEGAAAGHGRDGEPYDDDDDDDDDEEEEEEEGEEEEQEQEEEYTAEAAKVQAAQAQVAQAAPRRMEAARGRHRPDAAGRVAPAGSAGQVVTGRSPTVAPPPPPRGRVGAVENAQASVGLAAADDLVGGGLAGGSGTSARRRRAQGGGVKGIQRRAEAPEQPWRPEPSEPDDKENEELVAYLEETGSILALAALMDERGSPTVAAR